VPALRANLRPYGTLDPDFDPLVERVLDDPAVPERLRCLALSTFVRETSDIADPRTEPAYVEAREIAYRLDDPVLIGMALWAGGEVYLPDRNPAERQAIVREVRALADRSELPVFQVLAHIITAYGLGVELRFDEARWEVEQAAVLSRKFQLRQGTFIANVMLAEYELVTGDAERAAGMYVEEFEYQRSVGSVDAGAALLLGLTMVRFAQGRLDELLPELRAGYREVPAIGHLLGLALAETGRLDEARALLDELDEPRGDYLWQLLACVRAHVVAAVGDAGRAARLYDALLPFAGQVAGAGTTGFVFAPVAGALGRLARVLDRPDDAGRHFEQALAVAERCGSPAWIARAREDLAAGSIHPLAEVEGHSG
jgi:tetratricopeptide (TPR) repeat protein